MEIRGILVCMSEGVYVPKIETIDYGTMKSELCDYNSPMAKRAGLDNPKHWAHAVYRTLLRLCDGYQQELQGR